MKLTGLRSASLELDSWQSRPLCAAKYHQRALGIVTVSSVGICVQASAAWQRHQGKLLQDNCQASRTLQVSGGHT